MRSGQWGAQQGISGARSTRYHWPQFDCSNRFPFSSTLPNDGRTTKISRKSRRQPTSAHSQRSNDVDTLTKLRAGVDKQREAIVEPEGEPLNKRLITPSKITAWLDCPHYLTLRSQVDAGQREEPKPTFGSFAELLQRKVAP